MKTIAELEGILESIASITEVAEHWCDEQIGPESQICMAALKDVRRKTLEFRKENSNG